MLFRSGKESETESIGIGNGSVRGAGVGVGAEGGLGRLEFRVEGSGF